MNFEFYFEEQLEKHSSMGYQDAVKLCYQAAFGAEHLLSDKDRARTYLFEEFDSISATDEPLFERISPEYVRVNLGAWKREGFPRQALFEIFADTASQKSGTVETFLSYITIAEEIMSKKIRNFNREEWRTFLDEYKKMGMPPVHHSDEYRKNENPHYRVVFNKGFER
jgi:hypothetical protein